MKMKMMLLASCAVMIGGCPMGCSLGPPNAFPKEFTPIVQAAIEQLSKGALDKAGVTASVTGRDPGIVGFARITFEAGGKLENVDVSASASAGVSGMPQEVRDELLRQLTSDPNLSNEAKIGLLAALGIKVEAPKATTPTPNP